MVYDFKWTKPELPQAKDNNDLAIGLELNNWSPCKLPPQQSMQGKYCTVELFNYEQHGEGLFESFLLDKQSHNWAYLPYGPFNSLGDFENWCKSTCTSNDPLFHTIKDTQSGKFTGMASFLRITPDVGSIEVGHIHFSPAMQQTRLSTECMYLMMRRVFDELGYRRYEWKCNALNTPSCKTAERLGFQFEGIFRQATITKNRNRDTAWFSIIDSEWPKLKNGFEAWLSDANFDSKGMQVRSLTACFEST